MSANPLDDRSDVLHPCYCPNCRKPATSDSLTCPKCDANYVPQGFCEICESFALGQPGELCPKHDVPLLDGPVAPDFDHSSTPMIVLARYSVPSEARGPILRLQAEGIPSFLDGEHMGANLVFQGTSGGVRLLVAEEFAAEARVLLSQSWAPVETPEDQAEDDWEGLDAPSQSERRRAVMKKMIIFHLSWPLLAGFIVWFLARFLG